MKKKNIKKMYKKLKKQYSKLQESYDEACDYLVIYSQDIKEMEKLMRYQHDYIHWKNLDAEFKTFQKSAHEEGSDVPFPYLIM